MSALLGCCIPFCINNKKKNDEERTCNSFSNQCLYFNIPPPGYAKRDAWLAIIDFLRRPLGPASIINSQNLLICMNHFESALFFDGWSLKPDAVPTIFPQPAISAALNLIQQRLVTPSTSTNEPFPVAVFSNNVAPSSVLPSPSAVEQLNTASKLFIQHQTRPDLLDQSVLLIQTPTADQTMTTSSSTPPVIVIDDDDDDVRISPAAGPEFLPIKSEEEIAKSTAADDQMLAKPKQPDQLFCALCVFSVRAGLSISQ